MHPRVGAAKAIEFLIADVLHVFLVHNRRNMFVCLDNSTGKVFYFLLRKEEEQTKTQERTGSSTTNNTSTPSTPTASGTNTPPTHSATSGNNLSGGTPTTGRGLKNDTPNSPTLQSNDESDSSPFPSSSSSSSSSSITSYSEVVSPYLGSTFSPLSSAKSVSGSFPSNPEDGSENSKVEQRLVFEVLLFLSLPISILFFQFSRSKILGFRCMGWCFQVQRSQYIFTNY